MYFQNTEREDVSTNGRLIDEQDKRLLSSSSASAYGLLATEYYDRVRHPTCANFAAIQDAILESFQPLVCGGGRYVEFGCGRGRLDQLVASESVVLTDVSEAMLGLARERTKNKVCCKRMDAFEPHFTPNSLQGVFAFLADPYNELLFFRQVHRILANGGRFVITVPHHEWAVAVRTELQIGHDKTAFFHRNGLTITAPSITRSVPDQCELFSSAGFGNIAVRTFSLDVCPSSAPSHHVLMAADRLGMNARDVPLLDVFVGTKSHC